MIKIALVTAATALVAISTPAIAGSDTTKSMEVEYRDLNLSTAAGQELLDRRIDHAAAKVCMLGEHRTGTRVPSAERKDCFAKARATAKSQMASLVSQDRLGG